MVLGAGSIGITLNTHVDVVELSDDRKELLVNGSLCVVVKCIAVNRVFDDDFLGGHGFRFLDLRSRCTERALLGGVCGLVVGQVVALGQFIDVIIVANLGPGERSVGQTDATIDISHLGVEGIGIDAGVRTIQTKPVDVILEGSKVNLLAGGQYVLKRNLEGFREDLASLIVAVSVIGDLGVCPKHSLNEALCLVRVLVKPFFMGEEAVGDEGVSILGGHEHMGTRDRLHTGFVVRCKDHGCINLSGLECVRNGATVTGHDDFHVRVGETSSLKGIQEQTVGGGTLRANDFLALEVCDRLDVLGHHDCVCTGAEVVNHEVASIGHAVVLTGFHRIGVEGAECDGVLVVLPRLTGGVEIVCVLDVEANAEVLVEVGVLGALLTAVAPHDRGPAGIGVHEEGGIVGVASERVAGRELLEALAVVGDLPSDKTEDGDDEDDENETSEGGKFLEHGSVVIKRL